VVVLDGTDLAGTEHRLKPLRAIKAAGLPGRFVAAYELATGQVIDAEASEEAAPGDLFVADRHFCTAEVLFTIIDREACFVIRQHENLRWRPLKEARAVGRVATGRSWSRAPTPGRGGGCGGSSSRSTPRPTRGIPRSSC
jgi:hypothetical protein